VSESLPALAAVLRAAPGSDALVILGRLLDSLPIPFLVTDCSLELRFVYGNPAWRAGMPQERVPTAGQALEEILESLSLVPILRHACASGAAAHLRNLEHVGLAGTPVSLAGDVTVWDWEVYPLTDANDGNGHLLIVGMDATGRTIHGPGLSREARRRAAESRERASGILRIFGVAPGSDRHSQIARPTPRPTPRLTPREDEVAELVARGLSNATVAHRLSLSPATIASHVSHILEKLGASSRVEIAAWVVERRLRSE
jgi:DNA-binding CsgD family transcriptional regulator